MDILREIGKEGMNREIPRFRAGDTVRVYVKIVEIGGKKRVRPQFYEGVVIGRHNAGRTRPWYHRQ